MYYYMTKLELHGGIDEVVVSEEELEIDSYLFQKAPQRVVREMTEEEYFTYIEEMDTKLKYGNLVDGINI